MPILLWFLIAVVLSALALAPLSDPDLWWHLVVGRWILANGTVPVQDHWNEFAAGSPWIAYSWSNELLYAVAENFAALPGLLVLKLLLSVVLLLSLGHVFCRTAGNWLLGFALAIAVAAACWPYFGLRPQVISWLCCLGVLHFAERIRSGSHNKLDFVALFAIFTLWANSHITVVFGFIVLGFWLINSKTLLLTPATKILCFVATLCTPYLGREWLTLFSKAGHPFSHMYISEFQPANIFVLSTPVLLGLLVAVFATKKKSENSVLGGGRLFLAIAFLLAAITVQKFAPYAAMILAMLIASIYREQTAGEGHSMHNAPSHTFALASLVVLLAGGLLLMPKQLQQLRQELVDSNLVPVKAMNYIQQQQLPTPLLHGFTDGGYVLYRQSNESGVPTHKVFIDGRTNINSAEVTKTFRQALYGKKEWADLVNLTKANTVLWPKRFPLGALLEASGEWQKVYPQQAESNWLVFVRKE